MSETKFTPGPWEVRNRLDSIGQRIRGGRYVILQRGSSLREDFFICEMPFGAVRNKDAVEHQANAQLIAAAPDLYASCAEFLPILEGQLDSINPGGAAEGSNAYRVATERVGRLRAAIAKAQGE